MAEVKGPDATQLVVSHVRGMLDRGELRPGDRLPAERELARQLGVSRPSLRAGLRSLSVMGVVQIRPGAGSFIAGGPPAFGTDALRFQAALHGFTRDQMFQARLVLEVAVAGMAAGHATSDDLIAVSDEATGMFASMTDPQMFLRHDIEFHRAIAAACGNPILSALVNMVAEQFREQRQRTIDRASDLKEAADEHRAIYLALRAHDAERARRAMRDHLERAYRDQQREDQRADPTAGPPVGPEASVEPGTS
ncbi:MAG: FadR/GntR family transcriptional regulator [Acidobacteria bacterium]|nr:FadR/GntR family transcriptional regulator [Acidobacteriota bacterium]